MTDYPPIDISSAVGRASTRFGAVSSATSSPPPPLVAAELTIIDTDTVGVDAPAPPHGPILFQWTVPSGVSIMFDPMNKDCGVYFDNPVETPVHLIQVMLRTASGRDSRVWQGTPRSSSSGPGGLSAAHRWRVGMVAESGDTITVQCPTIGTGTGPDVKHIHLYVMSTTKLTRTKKPDPPAVVKDVKAEMDRQEQARKAEERSRKVCGAAILVNGKPSACLELNCTKHERGVEHGL